MWNNILKDTPFIVLGIRVVRPRSNFPDTLYYRRGVLLSESLEWTEKMWNYI